jgi:hypothetical protein
MNIIMKLNNIAQEIRELIKVRQQELGLTFEEDKHIYTMNGRKDYPSVSKVLKQFYTEFPTEEAAYNKAGGDPQKQQQLIEEWAAAGDYSTNMGSRVHYILEKSIIEKNGNYKELRQPAFDCDLSQMMKGDNMIVAGNKYIKLMEERGAVLLDTEIVLGDPELGYTGQPDKVWLMMNKEKTGFGLVITDWKTNKKKNFQETNYTKRLKEPFDKFPDTALGHYYLQLPLYGKLLLKMLEGTKYSDIKLYGCVITHLMDDSSYEEYKVPQEVNDIVLNMDIKKYLINKK